MSASVKRLIDVSIASIGLVMLAPVIAVAALGIRLQSPGRALFRQPRVGRNGRPFTCLKLRTMYLETVDRPTHETPSVAVTPVGRWLRRSKIDELPQLINVLFGDMSLVGPRPSLASQHQLILSRNKLGVLDVRPGITGLAQINGIDMSEPRHLARIDAIYVAQQSTLLDLFILGATITGGNAASGRKLHRLVRSANNIAD